MQIPPQLRCPKHGEPVAATAGAARVEGAGASPARAGGQEGAA